MSFFNPFGFLRRKFSLTARISALFILAVVLPLIITAVGSELFLRPTLVTQANDEMGKDAQSHASAIDTLFTTRLQYIGYLGQFLAIQNFLAGDDTYKQQALNELALGSRLDTNYSNWTLFDLQGDVRLSYPGPPAARGNYIIPPQYIEDLQGVNKTAISNVYFDDRSHTASVDIYTSITGPDAQQLGFGRSTLKLTEVWNAVNSETNATPGSYAMILDGHGVRIAYTNTDASFTTLPPAMFKPIAPLPTQFQQQVNDENLYGNAHSEVKTVDDPDLADWQNDIQRGSTAQWKPALLNEPFQAYRATTHIIPWTYLVLRPANTITKAANQQDLYLFLLAALVTLLAAFVGLLLGRSITRPILSAVSALSENSKMLKTLSAREQVTATEQRWIVDSAQTGLKAVQYYADATGVAARKLRETGEYLQQHLYKLDPQKVHSSIQEMVSAAQYIEKASAHQDQSSQNLSTAIQVTNEVSEQLVAGATSASDAATQVEEVITRLRHVVE